MPILSPKRQITLPKALCERLHVLPGDDLEILEHAERITIIKKRKGASDGVLKHPEADNRFTEQDSLLDTVAKRRGSTKDRRSAT